MTRPYPVIPGTTYMLTRQCSRRSWFLRPDKKINDIGRYCLAHAATMNGIVLHGASVMSSHPHVSYTDPLGNDPKFRQDFFSLYGRATNKLRNRVGHCFELPNHDTMELVDDGAQFRALVYMAVQPVEAGAVQHAHHWPGFITHPHDLHRPMKVKRPKTSFFANSSLPEEETLVFVPPPALADRPIEALQQQLQQAIAEAEAAARHKHLEAGRTFWGRRAVRDASPFTESTAEQPIRTLNPRIKCADPEKRCAAKMALKQFWCAYRRAYARLVRGDRSVAFPPGTWKLAVYYGVRCAPS